MTDYMAMIRDVVVFVVAEIAVLVFCLLIVYIWLNWSLLLVRIWLNWRGSS
jgi:hypothetical protein